MRRALHDRALLVHLARCLHVLGLTGCLPLGIAGRSAGHGLGVASFGRGPNVLDHALDLGTIVLGFGPELSELSLVAFAQLCLERRGLSGRVGELRLHGRFGGKSASLHSVTLGL
jgi:hypothetical protein